MIKCDQNDFYLQRNVWNSSYKLQVTDWTRVVSVWARIVQSLGPAKVEAWILAELTELLQTSHCTVSVLYTGLALACTDVTCFNIFRPGKALFSKYRDITCKHCNKFLNLSWWFLSFTSKSLLCCLRLSSELISVGDTPRFIFWLHKGKIKNRKIGLEISNICKCGRL